MPKHGGFTDEHGLLDFPALLRLSQTSKILFRFTDLNSISPLYWTGNPSTSGFSSPNLNLAYLDPTAYSAVFAPTANTFGPITGGIEGPCLRHTVLDHIMGKEKQTCLPTLTSIDEMPDTPEDEKTPWISTSTDLYWVIHEVCRRLVYLKRKSVWITIIAYPGMSGLHGHIDVNTSSNEDRQIGSQGRGVEVMVNPAVVLRMNHHKAKDLMLSIRMKEAYDSARKAAEISGERLIWGRIFPDSILYHTEFTLDVSPSGAGTSLSCDWLMGDSMCR